MQNLTQELIDKYRRTGKVGLFKPSCINEALDLINVIVSVSKQPAECIKLCDITKKLQEFFEEDLTS